MSAKLISCIYDHTFKVLKCGAGENWRKSVAPIVWRVKKYYRSQRGKDHHTYTTGRRKGDWIGYILRRNCLFKIPYEGKIEGKLDTTGRWGRRGKQTLDDLKEKNRSWNLKSTRSHSREIAVEKSIDLSQDGLRNDNHLAITCIRLYNPFVSTESLQSDKTPLLMVNRRRQFQPKL